MTRALAFACRSLIRQPVRASLGVVGIAIVGALLLDMLMLSRGLVVSFRELLDSIGFDVRVTSTDAMPMTGPRILAFAGIVTAIEALPEVASVVALRMAEGYAAAPNGRAYGFVLIGADPRGRRPWTVLEGDGFRGQVSGTGLGDRPTNPSPKPDPAPGLLVNRALAAAIGASPGAVVTVRPSCDDAAAVPPARFIVEGIAAFPFDYPGQLTAATTLDGLARACGGAGADAADMLLIASREGHGSAAAVDAIRRARPDLHAFTNEEVVARMQRTGFSYFRQISTVLSTITLAFGFLLITVLLTVSVNQRLAEIAALRALGFSRARVVTDVLCQSALLVGAGGLLAAPLGMALSRWLDAILKAMPGVPASLHFFVFEPRALGVHAVLMTITAVTAALYPMMLVARLPIAATLRNEVVS